MAPIGRPVLLLIGLSLCVSTACGQANVNEPHIGYLYPSGGQQGCVVRITAGGQFLRGAADVYVTGEGVRASVIQYIPPFRNLMAEQRRLLQNRFRELREKRLAELRQTGGGQPISPQKQPATKKADTPGASSTQTDAAKEGVKLPDHPLLYDLENKSLRELAHITHVLFASRAKQQPNRQLAESVLIEVTIDSDALPGNRELRLVTNTGLTNPMVFQVGLLPEIHELEPNDREESADRTNLPGVLNVPKEEPLELPVLLNGQILPGDVDEFRFRARQGQNLVIEAQARSLIPYLADAVPGWFQAALSLYDANGKEVAFADDYRFNPDPVLFYRIPADGEYVLQIHDAIYRGREDFVYRISVSERRFITQMFPLGARIGAEAVATIGGWNLPPTRVPLDTKPGDISTRTAAYYREKQLSNSVLYAVDILPECSETEPNDTIQDARRIELPMVINGRIDRRGDLDRFQFAAVAGEKVVAEVYARRLHSPLDSLLRLTDASGNVVAWNDDYVIEDDYLYKDTAGLLTHHADSYLIAELPRDGEYFVELSDSQHHGGEAYGYRLRISAPRPDFALRVTPSSLRVGPGGIVPLRVYALRKDGFDGEIEVVLKDALAGFQLSGGRIPAGRDQVRMTLTAPPQAAGRATALQLEGRARVSGQTLSRPAVPADDVMQAFLYRHLVPAQELVVFVQNTRWRAPSMDLANDVPVRIPAGGSARVLIQTRRSPMLEQLRLQLHEPPPGLTLHDVTVVPQGLSFHLRAEKDAVQAPFADNLIVEAFRETAVPQKDGKPSNQRRRSTVGVLPAIPIEIVRR